jgi:hypothetical protein
MYKYKLTEQEENKVKEFHDKRIMAFDTLEFRLEEIKKLLRQGKIETIKYYRDNPTKMSVVLGTDMVGQLMDDIETLLKPEEE